MGLTLHLREDSLFSRCSRWIRVSASALHKTGLVLQLDMQQAHYGGQANSDAFGMSTCMRLINTALLAERSVFSRSLQQRQPARLH